MSDPVRWISVGELAEAFDPDNFTPPATSDLAGATHVLYFEDGRNVEYSLSDRVAAAVEGQRGDGGVQRAAAPDAAGCRPAPPRRQPRERPSTSPSRRGKVSISSISLPERLRPRR